MHIVLLEPFFTGSHKAWAEQLSRFSNHEITFLTMEGKFWKWRMHGGAVTLARKFNELTFQPDLILASDMLNLSSFLALTRHRTANIPAALYCHENQMVYPWGERILRNNNWRHYAFINYISALSAEHVLFNSSFHFNAFFAELPQLLTSYHDHQETGTIETIRNKSSVLPLALDLKSFEQYKPSEKVFNQPPLILWNHRWEEDKDPKTFALLMQDLHHAGYDFNIALLGEQTQKSLEAFEQLRSTLGQKNLQFGYAASFADYAYQLWRADLLPVTSNQDFFGGSVVEAIYCGCYPLLPNRLAYPEHVPSGEEQVL
ncbi:MAG: DUF3524 domain-containing protein [Bacteroidetes bacterium SW_11_45_7]|nr:MAG: DUF3524 domain-containing protein [Bacteroidetes bacterium SW_11_45_7]